MNSIHEIESTPGKRVEKVFLPMQPDDVYQTNADITQQETAADYKHSVSLHEGIQHFIA